MPPGWGGCGSDTTGLMHGKVLLIPLCVNVAENLALSLFFGGGETTWYPLFAQLCNYRLQNTRCEGGGEMVLIVSHLGFTDLTP